MEKMDAKLTLALIERNVSEILPFFMTTQQKI